MKSQRHCLPATASKGHKLVKDRLEQLPRDGQVKPLHHGLRRSAAASSHLGLSCGSQVYHVLIEAIYLGGRSGIAMLEVPFWAPVGPDGAPSA